MAAKKYPQVPAAKSAKAPASHGDFKQAEKARRVDSVESARTIYNRLETDNMLRFQVISRVRGQLEGNRPWDQAQMEANGVGWQCNNNWGDSAAMRDRILLPYWKTINDVPFRAVFTIDSMAPQSEKWQLAYSEAFDEFLHDWASDYDLQFKIFVSNLINYGPGIVQWGDAETPRYKAVNVTRVLWPKNCRMSPDEWEVVALTRDMPATELYEKVRDRKTSERSEYAGWNTNAVKAALVQSKDGGPSPDYRDYTRLQDQLINNDIAVTTPFSPIPVIWLYVKEFSGKICAYCFTRNDGVDDFLFKDDDAAESYRNLLGSVWYDTGVDGMVHSIQGFAVKNYYYAATINRIKCRLVDSATVSLGLNFQYQDGNTPDEQPPVASFGPINIWPSGLNQLPIYPNPNAGQHMMEVLQQNQAENAAQYRQNQQQIENSDTATQAKILAQQQGVITEASASVFLSQYGENILTEQVRRLRKRGNKNEDAKKFVRRLKERGVPEEVIYEKEIRVRTGANAGMANPALRSQNFQEGLQLARYPGMNTRWFLENIIANKYGANAVDKAILPEGAESEPIQRRQAIMENVAFGQGIPLPVAPEDAHYEHIQEHLKPLAGIVGSFKQNGQIAPEQASALVIALEHTGQHMSYLSRDETMKDAFQEIKPQFSLIQSIARGILTQMQAKSQEEQQPAPAMTG